jgi:site-specific DNA-methyltransferase (adenine-specific)
MARFLVVGDPVWDRVGYGGAVSDGADEPPVERPGGSGANVARALRSAGHEVWIAGLIGSDDPGRMLRADLVRREVDCAWLQQLPGASLACHIHLVPNGARSVQAVEPRWGALPTPPHPADVPGFDAVYLGASRQNHSLLLGRVVEEREPLIFRRADAALATGAGLAPHYVIGSAGELDVPAGGGANPWLALHARLGERLRGVLLWYGEASAAAYGEAGLDSTATLDLASPPIDPTGAEDAFAAGALHALVEGASLGEALRQGVRWGAAAAGVRASVPPPFGEIERLLTARRSSAGAGSPAAS